MKHDAGALYNEIDEYAADWLENLIRAGHIAPGVVDRRSIVDITPDDVLRYRQVHFFAGIGVWSHALRGAGWRDDRPVWTGSCPCQPFSAAGQGGGFDDERHLWPAFHHLVAQCRPATVFGEQVASKDGLAWLDLVQADMEAEDYAFGAFDICAAGFGAPHIRQRLYWTANTASQRWGQIGSDVIRSNGGSCEERRPAGLAVCGGIDLVVGVDPEGPQGRRLLPERADQLTPGPCGVAGELADADADHTERRTDASRRNIINGQDVGRPQGASDLEGRVGFSELADAADAGQFGRWSSETSDGRVAARLEPQRLRHARIEPTAGPTNGHWRDADWLLCRDGKWRPVRPGTFPLAHGAPARVGRLRAYGNAIVAAQAKAKAFIEASLISGLI